MNLIICIECDTLINLKRTLKSCVCKASGGHYLKDEINTIIYGPCIPLGINNVKLVKALKARNTPLGENFDVWVIGTSCKTITHQTKEEFFANN